MRLLVTGGAGFVGASFVRHAERAGHLVTVVDNLSAGLEENLAGTVARFIKADISKPGSLAIRDTFDAVVHMAAESHVDRSIEDPRDFVTSNVMGTLQVLEFVKSCKIPRLLQISTDEVYGSIEEGAWTERAPLAPRSPYSASKAGGDLLALSYVETYGLDVVITRCSNNYGPRQLPEKVIPRFVLALSEGKNVPLYGDGLHVRDWLHVDDHCRALLLALEHGRSGRVYNIGGGTSLTNFDLTQRILKEMGVAEDRIDYVEDRRGHDRRYAVVWERARSELGYEPQVDFSEGLTSTVKWYLDNPEWVAAAHRKLATIRNVSKS